MKLTVTIEQPEYASIASVTITTGDENACEIARQIGDAAKAAMLAAGFAIDSVAEVFKEPA